ncbi:hypothetical protein [Paenibacillus arenilitoris]|uniref:Uncharacterized protein n=1 Tax=Paenibacillus arenilitoris TaxID=2772299 RepID=A0A927CL77_9BACL|nr:hypothetical protein [Paenibacillus arenilitoris]MBD2867685.1 hypothetical protein [Paenibacillus arenilitoris]
MKRAFVMLLSIIGGLIGGFVLYELIVRITLQLVDQVPIAFIAILANVLPIGGAIAGGLLARKRRPVQRRP